MIIALRRYDGGNVVDEEIEEVPTMGQSMGNDVAGDGSSGLEIWPKKLELLCKVFGIDNGEDGGKQSRVRMIWEESQDERSSILVLNSTI